MIRPAESNHDRRPFPSRRDRPVVRSDVVHGEEKGSGEARVPSGVSRQRSCRLTWRRVERGGGVFADVEGSGQGRTAASRSSAHRGRRGDGRRGDRPPRRRRSRSTSSIRSTIATSQRSGGSGRSSARRSGRAPRLATTRRPSPAAPDSAPRTEEEASGRHGRPRLDPLARAERREPAPAFPR